MVLCHNKADTAPFGVPEMTVRPLVAALALLAATVLPALADVGTTIATTTVYADRNTSFGVVGTLPSGTYIEGSCYRDNWCQISGGGISGWVIADTVGMNSVAQPQPQPQPQPQQPSQAWPWPQQPTPVFPWPQPEQPRPPRPQPQPIYEDAGACFFSERNFRGSSFCVDEGDSYSRLRNWNDMIRSVQVFGGARVDLCSDPGLYGNCVTLRSDKPRLPSALDRRASSLDVY